MIFLAVWRRCTGERSYMQDKLHNNEDTDLKGYKNAGCMCPILGDNWDSIKVKR